MRYTHAWGNTEWKELEMPDCSRQAWNAPKGIEGFIHWIGGKLSKLDYARFVDGQERKADYIELDGDRFERVRTCEYVGDEISGGCSECRGWLDPAYTYCPSCGAKVVEHD